MEHRATVFGLDVQKIFEHWGPSIIAGLVVMYVNSAVTQSQVSVLRDQVTELKSQVNRMDDKVGEQNGKLIGLNAQVAAYLGQQTQLNAAMDARLTYLERAQQRSQDLHDGRR